MSGVVERLRETDEAEARVIARLNALNFNIEYLRDDIESQYSDRELDEAYRLIMAN